MKKRLWMGIALIALIATASLIAFNVGAQYSGEPSLASVEAGDVSDSASQTMSVAGDSSPVKPDSANGVVQVDTPIGKGLETKPEIVSSTADQSGGPSEGIGVVGSWTIDVLEPNGRLVSHTEFRNAFGGQEILKEILARQGTVGYWRITVLSDPPGICNNSSGTPSLCVITEPGGTGTGPNVYSNLVVDTVEPSAGTGWVRLSGSATADNDASIFKVQTQMSTCSPDVAPDSCVGSNLRGFTSKILDSQIPVLADQEVQVTVEIQFVTAS